MTTPALVIERLRAERARRVVLRYLDLSVARGEWLALLGANGSGKSTLLDCCVGRLAPASGDVCVDGHSIVTSQVEAKQRLGYAAPPNACPRC
jgi:ABC-type multidrug transport system ATPase subunit